MDINKSLRKAIDTGDVKLGCNQTSKAIEKGEVKLVILSSNCPSDTVNFAEGSKANVHKFNGNNATLGAACGKPFPVAAVAIVNDGKSDILELKQG